MKTVALEVGIHKILPKYYHVRHSAVLEVWPLSAEATSCNGRRNKIVKKQKPPAWTAPEIMTAPVAAAAAVP